MNIPVVCVCMNVWCMCMYVCAWVECVMYVCVCDVCVHVCTCVTLCMLVEARGHHMSSPFNSHPIPLRQSVMYLYFNGIHLAEEGEEETEKGLSVMNLVWWTLTPLKQQWPRDKGCFSCRMETCADYKWHHSGCCHGVKFSWLSFSSMVVGWRSHF